MIDIRTTLKHRYDIPFQDICHAILGKKFELSIIVCGDTLARHINKSGRKKSYTPNVLSFPIDAKTGELILNVRQAEREAHRYTHTKKEHVVYLVIHGLLHLKGMDHGATMDRAELRFMKQFAHTL
ncbi:MAG: hypothetical protein RI911_565 [Candidatus Parcubacteria bacterium]|jgi:probable rRNA maturation factor